MKEGLWLNDRLACIQKTVSCNLSFIVFLTMIFFLSYIPSINPSLTSDNSNPLLPSSHLTLPLSKVKQLEWIDGFWRGKIAAAEEGRKQDKKGEV